MPDTLSDAIASRQAIEGARYALATAKAEASGIRSTAHTLSDEVRLRESEVALLLSMSPATLRNRRALGDPILPYEKVSAGTVRYRMGEIRAFLKDRTEHLPSRRRLPVRR